MEEATQLKMGRTQAKTKVNTAARKLTGLIDRKSDEKCIEKFLLDLEEAMANFEIVNEEYCALVENDEQLKDFKTVNNQDLASYNRGVKEVYCAAIDKFNSYKTSHLQGVKASPLLIQLEHCKGRLESLCEKTESIVKEGNVSCSEVFEGLSRQFNPLIAECQTLLSQLGELVSQDEMHRLSEGVKTVLSRSDSLLFACTASLSKQMSAHDLLASDHVVNFECPSQTSYRSLSPHVKPSPSEHKTNTHSVSEKGPSKSTVFEPKTYVPHAAGSSDIHIKKINLPEFSGQRRDWPEFKAIWRELAESALSSRSALAYELKRSLKGQAKDRVKNVFVTKPEAYETMWSRLCEYYDDISAGVDTALDCLRKLKNVREDDYKGIVHLVDEVEAAYAQLEELGQVNVISTREIDNICELLPSSTRMVWIRAYHEFSAEDKIRPLNRFLKFLQNERASVARLAEGQKGKRSHASDANAVSLGKSSHKQSGKLCVVHKGENVKHKTEDCKDFKVLSLDEKFNALRDSHVCFRCFGLHRRDQCKSKIRCDVCKKVNHHTLLCKLAGNATALEVSKPMVSSCSNVVKAPSSVSMYAIQYAFVVNGAKCANMFCDNGSNTSYITHRAAEKLRARKLDKYTLDITTMGNVNREYDTRLYEISIRTINGEIVPVLAFGIEQITGPVSYLDIECLSKLFPHRDVSVLQRKSASVDVLLGCDYFGLHPKHEVCTNGNLSIMRGELGVCLVGSHPSLREGTEMSCNMVKVVHDSRLRVNCNFVQQKQLLQPDLSQPCIQHRDCDVNLIVAGKSLDYVYSFIQGEDLATGASPKCGGCKCGKCPSVGHTYSFREEQELKFIQDNLKYSESERCWYTSYPWLIDPVQLPENYHVAVATLRNTERTLLRDQLWLSKYKAQIDDMIDRGVARKLSEDELKSWQGPRFYISHLAVSNPKSQTTPVRIVFNSSQTCGGVSLNSALAKGPDSYMNNLLGLLLRWRENSVAVVGDIRKMFHSVKLEQLEQHCHRFLWRDMDVSREPDVYVMLRVNMGDTPAPAICTEALYKTAEMFGEECPRAALMITKSTYVDDVVDSFSDKQLANQVVRSAEQMLEKGGFHIKCWLFSGESETGSQLKCSGAVTRVLGVDWDSQKDKMVFRAVLNFSPKKRGERTGPNLTVSDIPHGVPTVLTRRVVLQQVMLIFDPLGLLSPFTFVAKLYLRETWAVKLGWDDPLPPELFEKWLNFFQSMFQLNDLSYDRKLCPADAVGDPWLILLSDASDHAYGFVAYVRWRLSSGGFWCRLIMAKCRIAPLRKLSTPQMELNAALLSARGRKVLEKEMRFKFERVLHLVDSETVLNMLNKTSTRFKVFEGVRIGEIQAATNGNMCDWAWLSGKENTADWLTRGREPHELGCESDWWVGPSILYKEIDEWDLKFGLQRDVSLPGEKKLACVSVAHSVSKASLDIDYSRFGSIGRAYWVIARLLGIARERSFKGGRTACITPELLLKAKMLVVKDVQSSCVHEFQKVNGRFKVLSPTLESCGIWVVGRRLVNQNPMTPESKAQALMPADHVVTHMLMRQAHVKSGHRGRDATVARFRGEYWTPHASKLAWSVKNSCQLCKLRDAKFLEQEMGMLPESRLKPSPPFSHVMLDIFGPFKVRGEVQKRTSGKAYGVLFTDMTMRAVHVEGVFGYDTDSFLLALSRFVSVRGWPTMIYSDPGSQLVSVERELREAWANLDRVSLIKKGTDNGLTWVFGPADSPWYQGAVEALIKSVKRAFVFAFHGKRFSPAEFLSVCYEVANMLNERPIGSLPSVDAEISILTPNCLLLGRATVQNPGGWQPNSNYLQKFHLVQSIANCFWERWCELCAPALVVQKKWHTSHRNLQPSDVVIVADKNSLRGQYRVALVKKVFPGKDGKVRRVTLSYKNFKVGEKLEKYSGAPDTEVMRSVHRLALLVPCNEN